MCVLVGRTGRESQVVRVALEDMSSDPQHPSKRLDLVVSAPVIPGLGAEDRIPSWIVGEPV